MLVVVAKALTATSGLQRAVPHRLIDGLASISETRPVMPGASGTAPAYTQANLSAFRFPHCAETLGTRFTMSDLLAALRAELGTVRVVASNAGLGRISLPCLDLAGLTSYHSGKGR